MKYLVLLLVLIWFIGITEISYAEEFYESPNLITVIEKESFLRSNFVYDDVISINGYVMENYGLTKVGNAKIIFSLMWPNNTKILLEEKFANESGDFSLLIPISSNFIAGKYHLIAEPFWLGYQPTLESKKKILEFFVSQDKHDLIMSPLKQFKSGARIDQIQCNEGFVIALKSSNGNPACVKRESLEKLRERGWTEPLGDVVFQRTNPIESDYSPYETRCSSGVVPFIPENWQTTGMNPSDETWETLGKHLVKQVFYQELQHRNIIFEPACFGVSTGFVETSYPARYSMCTVVTANGSSIYLEALVNEFDVTNFEINDEIPYSCDETHFGCLCGLENEN